MKIKKEAKIKCVEELRELCIKIGWFTKGNTDEYDSFLKNGDEVATNRKLLNMAKMVYKCSNKKYWDNEQDAMKNIIFILWKDGTDHFAWVEE